MKYLRNINLGSLLKKKSIILFGPRSTGKSYYIRNQLKNIFYINLLKSSEYLALSRSPDALDSMVLGHRDKIIVIDEIQKIPELFDWAGA